MYTSMCLQKYFTFFKYNLNCSFICVRSQKTCAHVTSYSNQPVHLCNLIGAFAQCMILNYPMSEQQWLIIPSRSTDWSLEQQLPHTQTHSTTMQFICKHVLISILQQTTITLPHLGFLSFLLSGIGVLNQFCVVHIRTTLARGISQSVDFSHELLPPHFRPNSDQLWQE